MRPATFALTLLWILTVSACSPSGSPEPGGLTIEPVLAGTDEFIRRWNAAPIGVPPELMSLPRTGHDQPIFVAGVVSNFAKDDRGFATLRADLDLIDPSGEPIFHEPGFAAYDGKPEPGRTTLLIRSENVLTIETTDGVGTFTIRLRVTDLVSGESSEGRAKIDIRGG